MKVKRRRYEVDINGEKRDLTIRDLSNYLRSLEPGMSIVVTPVEIYIIYEEVKD